ncbi:hypothetical protein D1872_284700 [compost metagenome]
MIMTGLVKIGWCGTSSCVISCGSGVEEASTCEAVDPVKLLPVSEGSSVNISTAITDFIRNVDIMVGSLLKDGRICH